MPPIHFPLVSNPATSSNRYTGIQPLKPWNLSLEENQKLTQMGRLTSSIRFVDVSEKECQVSIDEYYTVMVIKRDSTPTIQINLNNIKSAKILPKVIDIT